MHAGMHACIHAYIHRYLNTYIHTYTHYDSCVCVWFCVSVCVCLAVYVSTSLHGMDISAQGLWFRLGSEQWVLCIGKCECGRYHSKPSPKLAIDFGHRLN